MAYENVTLKELMDAVRKERQALVTETDDFFADEFFDTPEIPEETKKIDIDACINETLSDMESYHLTAKEQQTVREFLTLRLQTRQASADQPEARRAYYNLLIHSDEKERIRRFAEMLRLALDIRQDEVLFFTEKTLFQRLDPNSQSRLSSTFEELIPNSIRFLLIDECQEAPRLNMEGGGAARDASRKAIDAYNAIWNMVLSYIRQNPDVILVVGADEGVYRSTLQPFSELSLRICSHHILLTPQNEDELLADCMTELRKSSFNLTEDFEAQLRKHFHSAYRTSDLRGQAFVSDLIDRIYARYYCRRQDSCILNADCIPEYDPLVQSAECILGQLDDLVGLETVKAEFRNIYRMQVAGLTNSEDMHYHMLFAGNPGTGKTTVARMAADLFFRMGIIKTNKLVIVKPCDLVSEWIGGTGMKATEVIRRAYNGVLFIDEAYGIANMDRGEELLNVLLQEMENHADKLIVIFAGYTDEMRELLKSNPGLASRIGQEIHFDDYTQEELAQIFLQMCKKDGFSLDPSARDELDDCIGALMPREFFGNARDIRNMLQDLKEAWSEDYYDTITEHGGEAKI